MNLALLSFIISLLALCISAAGYWHTRRVFVIANYPVLEVALQSFSSEGYLCLEIRNRNQSTLNADVWISVHIADSAKKNFFAWKRWLVYSPKGKVSVSLSAGENKIHVLAQKPFKDFVLINFPKKLSELKARLIEPTGHFGLIKDGMGQAAYRPEKPPEHRYFDILEKSPFFVRIHIEYCPIFLGAKKLKLTPKLYRLKPETFNDDNELRRWEAQETKFLW